MEQAKGKTTGRLMNEEDVKALIDAAIKQHNINATLVSFALGSGLLWFYADGVIRLVG